MHSSHPSIEANASLSFWLWFWLWPLRKATNLASSFQRHILFLNHGARMQPPVEVIHCAIAGSDGSEARSDGCATACNTPDPLSRNSTHVVGIAFEVQDKAVGFGLQGNHLRSLPRFGSFGVLRFDSLSNHNRLQKLWISCCTSADLAAN